MDRQTAEQELDAIIARMVNEREELKATAIRKLGPVRGIRWFEKAMKKSDAELLDLARRLDEESGNV